MTAPGLADSASVHAPVCAGNNGDFERLGYQTPIRNKEEGVRDKKAPAVLDLYNIMQDIGQHFRVYNIFGDYFNVLLPIDCAIQQDDTSPYYFATVQMDVTCPSMSSENNPEIEELI